jgi:hypothetical protein
VAALGEQLNAAQLRLDETQVQIDEADARIAETKAEIARLRRSRSSTSRMLQSRTSSVSTGRSRLAATTSSSTISLSRRTTSRFSAPKPSVRGGERRRSATSSRKPRRKPPPPPPSSSPCSPKSKASWVSSSVNSRLLAPQASPRRVARAHGRDRHRTPMVARRLRSRSHRHNSASRMSTPRRVPTPTTARA